VFFFSGNQPVSLGLTFICGALSMAVGTPVNVLMLRSAKKSEMMAAAIMQAAFNVANSLGAYFGGIPLKHGFGYQYPSLVGAVMAFAGLGLCVLFIRRYQQERAFNKVPAVAATTRIIAPESHEATCP